MEKSLGARKESCSEVEEVEVEEREIGREGRIENQLQLIDTGFLSYLPLTSVIEMLPMMGRDLFDWISQIKGRTVLSNGWKVQHTPVFFNHG